MISVIIRSKNEARWISRCLNAIALQDECDREVVVVDNESTDGTPQLARRLGAKVIPIRNKEFTYGRALNWGIRASQGERVAILSAHCIPVHNRWLTQLAGAFLSPQVAAVYGRQEPLPDSHPFDKRDLWTTFGIERRIQTRDFFFHNANSMVRRDVWEKIPFDDRINGVEDRDWARKALARGWHIVYEPQASVYHWHGIHQGRDEKRAERVVRVIQLIHDGHYAKDASRFTLHASRKRLK